MRQVLHILKRNDPDAISIIQQQAKESSIEVVLIQDAASFAFDAGGDISIFVLADDATGESRYPTLSYRDLIEKIFRADTVVAW